jgi:hypothetical protein
MRLSCAALAAAIAFLFLAAPANAHDPCRRLTGQALRDCRRDAYMRELERREREVCEIANRADAKARALHSRAERRVYWNGRVWTWSSRRELANAAQAQRRACVRARRDLRLFRRRR